MSALPLMLALLGAPLPAESSQLEISPLVVQNAVLFLSRDVTAGGVGGGVGVQMLYAKRYLVQADFTALWGLGTALDTRLAAGTQLELGNWVPAAWISAGVLWGDRVEFLEDSGKRPNRPSWTVGVRLSPLRFTTSDTAISALEPGIGTDFDGGLGLELNVLQVASRF